MNLKNFNKIDTSCLTHNLEDTSKECQGFKKCHKVISLESNHIF
jgi:hypothetical protein